MNKVIFNSEHVGTFKSLLKISDEVIVMSPFLSFFKDFNIGDYNVNLKLYTKITENRKDAANAERYLVIEKLIDLYDKSKNEFLLFNIKNLHSKIYIFKKNKNIHHVIITSANYTSAGLEGTNEECGIVTDNINDLNSIKNYLNMFCACPVNKDSLIAQIKNIKPDISEYSKTNRLKTEKFNIKIEYDSTLIQNSISEADFPTIWLKPLGTSKEIENMTSRLIIRYIEQRKTDKQCSFRNNPKDVKVGDLLICYIVKIRKIICIRKVTSLPLKTDPDWQWPWSVKIESIDGLPDLQLNDNYRLDDLLSDFLNKNPNGYVDYYNNQNFRQIKRWDKLELTKEFGKSAIESYLQHLNL